jgi:hypothetical protein
MHVMDIERRESRFQRERREREYKKKKKKKKKNLPILFKFEKKGSFLRKLAT